MKVRRVRTSQPQHKAEIDWSNPITRDLAFAWSGATKGHFYPRGVFATTDNTTLGLTSFGMSAKCAAGQLNIERANFSPITTSDGAGGGDFTICVLSNPSSSSGGAVEHMVAQKNDAAGAPYAQLALLAHANSGGGHVSGSVAFFTYNSSGGGVAATAACDGEMHLWTGIRKTVLTLFKDGALIAGPAGAVKNISQANRHFAIGSRGNGTTEAFRNNAVFACGFNRALTSIEVASLSRNPWQIFKPRLLPVGGTVTAQFAHPTSDVSAGTWTASSGSDLFAMLDETTANDADYISTVNASICEVALGALTDPASSTGHVVRYRIAADSGGIIVRLRQGTTTIASWTHSPAPGSLTTYAQTLTGGEADSITNYAALKLQFEATP